MVRTQIYLTKNQRDELKAISKTAGKKQSEPFEKLSIVIDDELRPTGDRIAGGGRNLKDRRSSDFFLPGSGRN
jgi:hypothetical protein